MSNQINGNSGCYCVGKEESFLSSPKLKKQVVIEFLYLDQETCDPHRASEQNVLEALKEISSLLSSTGFEISLRKIQIDTLEQAVALGFQNSPTIRVNGREVELSYSRKECPSCGENGLGETSCRLWNFQGTGYQYLPKALLVGAILREIFEQDGSPERKTAPTTMKNFFRLKMESV
jgi:hypothetical protein